MSSHAQNSCTLAHITSVQAVYTYYYLASSDINSNMAPKDNVNPPGANTIRVTYEGNNYDWTLTEPSLDINNNIIQSAIGKLYVIECTLFTDTTYDWGPLMTSSTYAAAKAAYNLSVQAIADADDALTAINLLGGHFIYNGTSSGQSTPAGAGVIQYVEDDPDDWGYNTWIGSNGIQLRHGETVDAFLYTNGLIVEKGGIRTSSTGVYPPGTNNGIYISTDNYSDAVSGHNNGTIPLDNYTKTNWRAIIGSKFAVDSEGNLYANNANIEGSITATSLTIGTGQNAYSGIEAINISGYSISIVSDSTGVQDPSVGTNLYPHIYHNGIEITDNMIETEDTTIDTNKTYYSESGGVYTIATPVSNPKTEGLYEKEINPYDFLWYQDNNSIGTHGSSVDGHYYATYGHLYNVIYDFDDGAVGAGTAVQTREVDPQKYITKIDDAGITIHPEDQSNNNYMQLDASSLKFYQNNINVAEFGVNGIQIGQEEASRVYINYNSLRLLEKEGVPYIFFSDLREDNGKASITDVFYADGSLIYELSQPGPYNDPSTGFSVYVDDVLQTYNTHYTIGTNQLPNVPAFPPLYFGYISFRSAYTPEIDATIKINYTSSSRFVKAYTIGKRNQGEGINIGSMSVAEGYYNIATGFCSHVEGTLNEATGKFTHAEGNNTVASSIYAHSEGYKTISRGQGSHAEGYQCEVSGYRGCHAEGFNTFSGGSSSANGSHAEGNWTEARGLAAHAEGSYSIANGFCTHAQNEGTIATRRSQTAIGTFNIEDTSNNTTHITEDIEYGQYAFIIGNGYGENTNERSNALTVDWSGNIDAAGDIYPQNTKMVDFIIEQGTSGSWEYRKWKSGKIEAWYNSSITASATETSGALYRSTWSLSIPSAIGFTSAPKIIVNEDYDAVGVVSIIGKASSQTAISGKVWRTTASSGTYNGYPRIYAWGS